MVRVFVHILREKNAEQRKRVFSTAVPLRGDWFMSSRLSIGLLCTQRKHAPLSQVSLVTKAQ
jgi:hypothetical protein